MAKWFRPIYGDIVATLGALYAVRNQSREMLRMMQLSVELNDHNGGTSTQILSHQNFVGALSAVGENRAALAECEIINQRLAELKDSGLVQLSYTLTYAFTLARMGRPVGALTSVNSAIDQARSAGNPRWLTQGLHVRGSILVQLERWDEADIALHEAASLASGGGEYRPIGALIESYMARSDAARGNLDSAHHHRGRSLELAGYHTKSPQRALGRVLLNVAQVSLAEHATAATEQFARDALAFYEALARGPNTSADVGEALLHLAQARMTTGSRAEIRSMLERAVQCFTNGVAPNHPLTAEARTLLATIS